MAGQAWRTSKDSRDVSAFLMAALVMLLSSAMLAATWICARLRALAPDRGGADRGVPGLGARPQPQPQPQAQYQYQAQYQAQDRPPQACQGR